ncbi:MAG: hypothetical protein ACRD7E_03795 [Bryobacteraceae bacterium]
MKHLSGSLQQAIIHEGPTVTRFRFYEAGLGGRQRRNSAFEALTDVTLDAVDYPDLVAEYRLKVAQKYGQYCSGF